MSLYTKYEALSPIYQGGLTNHLPMMLNILEKWSVKPEDIEQLLDQYHNDRGIYDLTNTALPITEFEEQYVHLTNHYLHEFRNSNLKEVVSNFITNHQSNLPSALFHGIIRLYYSLQTDSELQVAQALAYFDLVTADYTITGKLVDANQIDYYIEKARETYISLGITLKSNSTTDKYFELINNESIRKLIVRSENGSFSKEEMLECILTRYLETEDFYILHLITGFHALIGLNKYNYNFQNTMKQFFMNAQVFFLLNPTKNTLQSQKILTKDELFENRYYITDAHDMKLFNSVLDLSYSFNNPKLLVVANKVIEKALKNTNNSYDIVD